MRKTRWLPVMSALLILARPAAAHEIRTCPAGINDTPAMAEHFDQPDILQMPFPLIFALGQNIFVTDFYACDGAGRPGTNGGATSRTPNPLEGPRLTRISAPDANSCAGCHSQPQAGGAGDFVANVFVLAQNAIPVSGVILNADFTETFLERNTLGMFGSGAIELLGREMTQDLQLLENQVVNQAASSGNDATVQLCNQQGADITFRPNFTGANNVIEDNFCLTYIAGAGPATAPCPNIVRNQENTQDGDR